MKRALFLPPFDDLADARLLAELAGEAERAGWDGIFLWDHVLRPDPPRPVADPWVALAAIAMTTDRMRLGPMVTPLVRRRPQKLAREIVTLDHLSGGRVTVGLGLGVDTGRELSAFGEVTDAAERGDLLDEGLTVLRGLVSGDRVDHRGRHFVAEGVTLSPPALQRPTPPFWMAARTMNQRPLRRAALADGLFPIEVAPEQVAEMLAVIGSHRPAGLDGFEVVALASGGWSRDEWAAVGATWWFADLGPGATATDVRELIHAR
jgi:alkanesulfonate monooxygenase SsuD/methylene tetrahydromethanopterin reductase-like flavin-dependent oxidoreductase (luciferase family)